MSLSKPSDRSRLWWCNADFDLTLAHGGGKMPAKILEAASAMSWPMWPALAPDDALCVPVAAPLEFLKYLEGLELHPPRFVTPEEDASRSRDRFTPFGWNAEAVRRNALRQHPNPHPTPEVVRLVNSRAYSLGLEHSLFGEDACPAWVCPTVRSVSTWVSGAALGAYIAKGNHGLAGIGQLRFQVDKEFSANSKEGGDLIRSLERLAARHGGLVIEQALQVEREWALLFRLARDGRVSAVRRHRLLSTPSGGYAGALVLPHGGDQEAEWSPHREKAKEVVNKVAAALHAEGYFGPVGLDLFTYGEHTLEGATQKNVRIRLRPLVDLNARHSMAWPAHGLAARFPDHAILFRQCQASAFKVPSDYVNLASTCDILSFNSVTRRGAIWLTPLLPLSRVSFAILGDDEQDVLRMQDELLDRLNAPSLASLTK